MMTTIEFEAKEAALAYLTRVVNGDTDRSIIEIAKRKMDAAATILAVTQYAS